MAKRFRIESLSREQQKELNNFFGEFVPQKFHNTFLDSLEETGAISGELFDQAKFTQKDRAFVAEKIAGITSGLPSKKEAYDKYIESQTDVPNLTTADLEERIGVLEKLDKERPTSINRDLVKRDVLAAMSDSGILSTHFDAVADVIADFVSKNLRPPTLAEAAPAIRGRIGGSGSIIPAPIQNFINNQDTTNRIIRLIQRETTPAETKESIKQIQDILADRSRREAAGADITGFFSTAASEQGARREAFFGGLRERAKDFVGSEFAPRARENLRSRGLARSGQVSDVIVSKYAELFGDISEQEAAQLQGDVEFFQQQQYDKVFGDLVSAGLDVGGTIETERGRVRSQQIVDFGRRQTDIESKFNLDLFREQSRSAYETYQKSIQAQNDARKRNAEADLIQSGTQAATTVALASLI